MKYIYGLMGTVLLVMSQTGNAMPPTATTEDFNDAVLSTSIVRTLYAETSQINAEIPSSLHDLGYDESVFQSDLISHIDIDPYSNSIMVGLTPQFGQNAWLALIPNINGYSVSGWTCQSTVDQNLMGATGCKGDLPYSAITQIIGPELFTETLISLAPIRTNYAESYQSTGSLPRSLLEIGVTPQWIAASNTDHVIIEARRRAILVGLSEAFGTNQWLAMVPKVTRFGRIRWRCRTTLPTSITGANSGCSTGLASEDLIR